MMNRLAEKGLRLEFWVALAVVGLLAGLLIRGLNDTADQALAAQARQAEVAFRSAVRGIHRVWQLQNKPVWAGPLIAPDAAVKGDTGQPRWYLKMNAGGWPVDARLEGTVKMDSAAQTPCERLWQALWVTPDLRYAGREVGVQALETGCAYHLPGGTLTYRFDSGQVVLEHKSL